MKSKDVGRLAKVYYDPSKPEGYAGASRLAKKFPNLPVKEWLAGERAYALHKPIRRKFPTRKYKTLGPNDLWQMDLMEMIPYASVNNGNKYILTCIDVYSRFAYAIPTKTKNSESMSDAIKKLISSAKVVPDNVQTDHGKEFYNKKVQEIFNQNNINHYSVESQFKAAVVERFNRTLRERLSRMFTHRGNKKWTAALPKIINAYNHSSHRSLKGKRPVDIKNDLQQWKELNKTMSSLKPRKKLYPTGTLVAISLISLTDPFKNKNFDHKWSYETFIIDSIDKADIPIMYVLKDSRGEILKGKFYHEELQDIKHLPKEFRIDKIIKTVGKGKNAKHLVKCTGYDKSFNSWITDSQLKV